MSSAPCITCPDSKCQIPGSPVVLHRLGQCLSQTGEAGTRLSGRVCGPWDTLRCKWDLLVGLTLGVTEEVFGSGGTRR